MYAKIYVPLGGRQRNYSEFIEAGSWQRLIVYISFPLTISGMHRALISGSIFESFWGWSRNILGKLGNHYNDVIMGTIASQITSLAIVYSTVYSEAYQRKHQSSASLAFVRGIHRGPVNYPHKWPVTRKMFPFDDVIMAMDIDALAPCVARPSAALLLTMSDKGSLSSLRMDFRYRYQLFVEKW